MLSANGLGGKYCGIAVEVGEAPDHPDFTAFKKAVIAKAKVQKERLADGEAEYTGACGRRIRLRFGDKPTETRVWRDGKLHDWAEHARYVYRAADGSPTIIEQRWLGDTLTVRTGKSVFTATVSEKGLVTFKNE